MRILLRSAVPSDKVPTISESLVNNYIGDNIGNVLFQNSVCRWLMTDEETKITRIKTNHKFTDKEIEYFNAEHDMLILPLANALRTDFIRELDIMTDLIEGLDMPCVVIGIGIQRELSETGWNFPFDEPTKHFFQAVLKKSAIVGVRGEMTARYLSHIGFTEGKDFTVIGCPSLYTYGYALPKPRLKELTVDSPITFNSTLQAHFYDFFEGQARRFKDYTYVCTVLNELRTLYVGYPYPRKDRETFLSKNMPIHFDNPLVKENRVVSFVDEYSWTNFLKTKDFSFGSRIHGTFANLLSGTPCVVFVRDNRVGELVDYHHIPHVFMDTVDENTNIFDIYEKADFNGILNGQKERVDHFVEFLDQNQVPHLAIEDMAGETPFDRAHNLAYSMGEIRHFIHQDPVEQERRLEEYFLAMWKVKNDFSKQCDRYAKSNAKLRKEVNDLKNSKFYKLQHGWHAVKSKIK